MAKKNTIIGVSIAVIVVLVAAVFLFSGVLHKSNGASSASADASRASAGNAAPQPSTAGSAQQSSQQQRIKLADTPYANYAYDISDNKTSSRETAALSGFAVQKTMQPNGSMKVVLKALEPQYQDQSFVVQPGQTLYFIEGAFGDDSGSREYSLGDDLAVLVDKNGYVIQG